MDFKRLDATFTDYVPKTAREAVELFYKKKNKNEIAWDDVDLLFQTLASDLDQPEFEKFVQWLNNPLCVPKGNTEDLFPTHGEIQSDEKMPEIPKLVRQESGPN